MAFEVTLLTNLCKLSLAKGIEIVFRSLFPTLPDQQPKDLIPPD